MDFLRYGAFNARVTAFLVFYFRTDILTPWNRARAAVNHAPLTLVPIDIGNIRSPKSVALVNSDRGGNTGRYYRRIPIEQSCDIFYTLLSKLKRRTQPSAICTINFNIQFLVYSFFASSAKNPYECKLEATYCFLLFRRRSIIVIVCITVRSNIG